MRREGSSTTRSGTRPREEPVRTVRLGSSTRTVPMPTRIASERARRRCTIFWAAGLVIQRDSPLAVAILPSKVAATFNVTNGRPVVISLRYGSMSRSASSAPTPTLTCSPARRNAANPRPRTWGFGSRIAATTRLMPLAMMSGTHGGVRLLRWQQGSSVTHSVAPLASRPAWRKAITSAWGPPARRWYPAPMIVPWRTTTAPTGGFGLVRPAPRQASARARAMNRSSCEKGDRLLFLIAIKK